MTDLTIAPATGSQGTTQNPQTVPTQTVGASNESGGVQPGTAEAVLTSQQGLSLHPSALTTVDLSGTSAAQTVSVPPKQKTHHAKPLFFGISIILIIIAIGLFWAMSRSAKSTTN